MNIARPEYAAIQHINIVDTNQNPDLEIPMGPMTDDAYAGIPIKTLTSTYPSQWWYNPTFPLGQLELWPVPSGSGLNGAIYVLTALAEVATSDTVSIPPAYRRMLETALAVEMAPAFERPPSQTLVNAAKMSMMVVKRANVRMSDLSVDAGALGSAWSRADRWSIWVGP